jgi:hypothetical protein
MLTDYDPDPVVACRHKWTFRCWRKDTGSGESSSLRWMVEVCRRCGASRITHYAGRTKMNGYSYAENVEEALLGRPYALQRVEAVLQN